MKLSPQNQEMYQNPVDKQSLPDSAVIRAKDGWFYLYATENIRHVPVLRSRSLTKWELIGRAFSKDTRPDFEPRADIWAPDINYLKSST